MKVLIIGLGAIGTRHYDLLAQKGIDTAVVTSRKDQSFRTYQDLEEALRDFSPDIAWICNETAKHWDTAMTCLSYSFVEKVLVEKPLAHRLVESLQSLSKNDQSRILITYNLRFSPLLQKLKTELDHANIIDATVNVGQDLNQWRRRQVSQTYSAKKAMGGGVLRDLSHELDYIEWLFGKAETQFSEVGKKSSLPIDCEDTVYSIFKTPRCSPIFLRMSYLDKVAVREIRVNTEKYTYTLDFLGGTLRKDELFLLEDHKVSQTYEHQVEALIKKDFQTFTSFSEGISTLKLIQALENSTS